METAEPGKIGKTNWIHEGSDLCLPASGAVSHSSYQLDHRPEQSDCANNSAFLPYITCSHSISIYTALSCQKNKNKSRNHKAIGIMPNFDLSLFISRKLSSGRWGDAIYQKNIFLFFLFSFQRTRILRSFAPLPGYMDIDLTPRRMISYTTGRQPISNGAVLIGISQCCRYSVIFY